MLRRYFGLGAFHRVPIGDRTNAPMPKLAEGLHLRLCSPHARGKGTRAYAILSGSAINFKVFLWVLLQGQRLVRFSPLEAPAQLYRPVSVAMNYCGHSMVEGWQRIPAVRFVS